MRRYERVKRIAIFSKNCFGCYFRGQVFISYDICRFGMGSPLYKIPFKRKNRERYDSQSKLLSIKFFVDDTYCRRSLCTLYILVKVDLQTIWITSFMNTPKEIFDAQSSLDCNNFGFLYAILVQTNVLAPSTAFYLWRHYKWECMWHFYERGNTFYSVSSIFKMVWALKLGRGYG